jgi:hypothetical protein
MMMKAERMFWNYRRIDEPKQENKISKGADDGRGSKKGEWMCKRACRDHMWATRRGADCGDKVRGVNNGS